MNLTTSYHTEMWLWNHTASKWVNVRSYSSTAQGDVWLNYTIDMPSPYVSSEGAIPVAMSGIHSENLLMVVPGHISTDYVRVSVTSAGGLTYPEDLTLSIDGTEIAMIPGNLTGTVTLDSSYSFGTNIQAVLDEYLVTPVNVTLVFEFSVGYVTAGWLNVSDLVIMYDLPVNLAPVYVGPVQIEIMEDAYWTEVLDLDMVFDDDHNKGVLEYDLPLIDSFPDLPIPLEWRLGTATSGNTSLDIKPVPDFYGDFPFEFNVTARDTFGLYSDAWLNFTVLPVGDRPKIEYPGVLPAHERTPFNYTMNVTDVDLPDDLFVFSDDSDLFDINPISGEIIWTPASDQIGSHSFHVTVEDSFGLSERVLLTINVQNSNDPPVITSALEVDSKQGIETSYILRAEDPDVPFGDVLQYNAFADAIDVIVDVATGRLTFTPSNEHVPDFDITIRVQDMQGELDEKVLHVNVENVNDAPVLTDYPKRIVDQHTNVTFQLEVVDLDIGLDIPLAESLTFSGSGKEAFMPDEDGLIVFSADQSLVGTHTITYTVTDASGAQDVTTITWEIRNVNDLPVITTDLSNGLEATEGTALVLELEASDLDGDTLTWSDDTVVFDIVPGTGLIEFTPNQSDVGVYSVSVTVRDGNGGNTVVTFDLAVLNVNDVPVILTVLPFTGSTYDEGTTIEFSATAEDEDGDTLTYTWKDGDKVLGTGPVLSTDNLETGERTITLVVEDGEGGTASQKLKVEVKASLGGSLMMIIVILVLVAVVVGTILYMRTRSAATADAAEKATSEPTKDAADEGGEEKIIRFGPAEAINFTPGEAPVDSPDIELDHVPTIEEEAPIYDLESAREFHVKSEEVEEPEVAEKEE